VCAIARSGSNLLTDGLRETGRAGRPKQFFCPLFERGYGAKYQLDPQHDFASYVRGIIEATATSNQVFGFKLMGWYLDHFLHRLRNTHAFGTGQDDDLLNEAFPRLQLIHIYRQNKLEQAISKARAYQSGLWKVQESEVKVRDATFDPQLIDRCLNEIRQEDEVWAQFFARSGVEPFRIEYEELCRAYRSIISAVLDFLKIRLPRKAVIGQPTTVRQADAISREWERRYRELMHAVPTA
jgi:LPS sulfotransferase NodH